MRRKNGIESLEEEDEDNQEIVAFTIPDKMYVTLMDLTPEEIATIPVYDMTRTAVGLWKPLNI